MNGLIFTLVTYTGALAFYAPQKQSLKDTSKSTVHSRLLASKGTLNLGLLLIALAIFSFDPVHYQIQNGYALLFGYNPQGFFGKHLYFQPLTSVFFHFNLLHLVANLSVLLLLSAYERRVGTVRFLSVFLVSGIAAAILDMLFIPFGVVSLGASGGIAGLAAGYILDKQNLTPKQWFQSCVQLVLLVLFLSIPQHGGLGPNITINWIDHLLGALSAALYVRYF